VRVVATTRTWLRHLVAASPSAWHDDPIFRWAAIGAGAALVAFALRVAGSPAPPLQTPAPGSSVPASLGPTYGTALPTPPVFPRIAPGRALDDVTIAPAHEDRFGVGPPATRQ
jgi:hypothetical protein